MTSRTTERTDTTSEATPGAARPGVPVYAALMGVSALAVLLQGLWAGIFLSHPAHVDSASSWIDVHARGGEVALLFAVLGTGWAFWKRRERKDLWLGGAAYALLLVIEAWIGGQIRDDGVDSLTAVHIPVAMACMAMAVWLPLRARRGRATA